ncbi:RAB6-interacting golgin-like [Lineus longissimus]|uniref:RAB6-interacting golgin-like n=1 Tax=Lineus longissimus TaxID=88925 RepID=UPI002B4EECD7
MAASGWSGFSDAELQRLKHSSDQNERAVSGNKMAKKFQYNPPKNPSRQSRPPPQGSTSKSLDPAAQLSSSQMLSKQPMKNTAEKPRNEASCGRLREQNGTVAPRIPDSPVDAVNSKAPEIEPETKAEQKSMSKKDSTEDVVVLGEKEILSMELANIANFQKQQKAMEELNKQKKIQLMKALEQRRKKAKAEAVKLTDIQKELGHLDALLSTEVCILRDKIEDASIHFTEAQKRYQKAEKEFVEAKLDLHSKSDTKEQLTEHLYTIIYQNEVRKAKKLAELMEKLEMECSAEDLTVDLPPLPQMGMMNSCQTLGPHGPVSPSHSRHSPLNQGEGGAAVGQSPISSPVVAQPTSPVTAQPVSPDKEKLTTDLKENSSPQLAETSLVDKPVDKTTDSNSNSDKEIGDGDNVSGQSVAKEESGSDKTCTDVRETAADKSQEVKDLAQNNNSSSRNTEANPVC